MKNLRTAAIALALTAVAAVAALPTVSAGDKVSKGKAVQASAPVPLCPLSSEDGCGIYK